MTLVSIRDAIVAVLEASWDKVTTPIYYQNTLEIDTTSIDQFMRCIIGFDTSEQINISPTPDHRIYGTLEFEIYVRTTVGQKVSFALIDSLKTIYTLKNIGNVHFGAPSIYETPTLEGWYTLRVSFHYYADSNT